MDWPSVHPWWMNAARLRVGLLKRPQPNVPHLTRPKYAAELDELDQFANWLTWFESGKKGPRPAFDRTVPAWAWTIEKEYAKRHPKPKPPASSPPPPKYQPKTKPSWTLTNGPWLYVTSDPGMCQAGPWTRLDIIENHVAPGAPLWYCNQGKVPQAEGGNQSSACLDWIKANPGSSIAPVTTLGIDPAPYAALGVTSCFVECYLQEQANALDKMWSAGQEGWADPIACVGVYHDYPFSNYADWLRQYGTRFGIYTSDAMSAQDWADLRAYLASL